MLLTYGMMITRLVPSASHHPHFRDYLSLSCDQSCPHHPSAQIQC